MLAQEHKFWPEKVFSTNNPPPPHLSSQNDQRDVGIILSHRCWVAPPPPPARQVGHPRPEHLLFYIMHVDRLLGTTEYHHAAYGRHFGKRILIATDTRLEDELLEFPMYDAVVSYGLPPKDRYTRRALEILLCDLLFLAELPVFVGTLSSQVGRMVVELRAAAADGARAFEGLASLDDGCAASPRVASRAQGSAARGDGGACADRCADPGPWPAFGRRGACGSWQSGGGGGGGAGL